MSQDEKKELAVWYWLPQAVEISSFFPSLKISSLQIQDPWSKEREKKKFFSHAAEASICGNQLATCRLRNAVRERKEREEREPQDSTLHAFQR
jgi:hypothetical protein